MEKNYKIHYEKAKAEYAKNNPVSSKLKMEDINVTIVNPALKTNPIDLPANYMQLIDGIADQVTKKFEVKENCFFPPDVKPDEDVSLRLEDKQGFTINGVEDLCQAIFPQLESKYFHSYLHLEKAYFYRNIITKNAPRTSWLWHYDNHPNEIHKVIIYLTEVTDTSGPFEYLKSPDGKAVIMAPSRTGMDHWKGPKWPNSRVPKDVMNDYLKKGYVATKVVGPKGLMMIFDNNCIHKANVGKTGYRDVISLQIRPSKTKLTPYMSPKWTGGFQANDIIKDPDVIAPYSKFKNKM
jgi:hypothetical protein